MLNNKKVLLILFAFLIAVQLYVPAAMIIKREISLRDGAEVKFKVMPVDPSDPFRGRYVSINIGNREVPVAENIDFLRNQTGYIILAKDPEGYSKMASVTKTVPKDEEYIKTKVINVYTNENGIKTASVDMPFDRYYMEEKAAPEAEKVYREKTRSGGQEAYVTVRIKDGFAVLEKLYIEGVPVEEYLKK